MLRECSLLEHLSDLVVICDDAGRISYANHAAQHWANTPLSGQPFTSLLAVDISHKGDLFLAAVRAATPDSPCPPWELSLGNDSTFTTGSFRGYLDDHDLVIIGQLIPEQVSAMQQELLALTSELTEAQREQRRQNRALKQALDEQQRMLETISDLTAPAVPIWDGVLLLSLVGHLDSNRSQRVAENLLGLVSERHTHYVILDVSGIAAVDTAVAQQLIHTAEALRLLGVQPILVGINPEIAQTIVHLGVQLPGFIVQADLQRAVAYVIKMQNKK